MGLDGRLGRLGQRGPAPGPRRSARAEAQGPGVGGGVTAQLVDRGRNALTRRGLDPPELQLGPTGFGLGILPPLPVDDPVLEDGADGVQPAPLHRDLDGGGRSPKHTL